MTQPTPAPFLRWAGSKRWLTRRLKPLADLPRRRYVEPFLGSGAIYFTCGAGGESLLSDTVEPLINCFEQVRDHPLQLARIARNWPVDRETYYLVRSLRFDDALHEAARFVYLNKTCFNGLYRVNKQGQFNVPYGRPKTPRILDEASLVAASVALTQPGTRIEVCDFEQTLEAAGFGDLVYVDPPYVAGHRNNGFIDYNAKLFCWQDQVRLAAACANARERGASVVISNADHESIRRLYTDYGFAHLGLSRYSSIASTNSRRGKSDELLSSTPEILNRISNG